jgi:hypothetical protein
MGRVVRRKMSLRDHLSCILATLEVVPNLALPGTTLTVRQRLQARYLLQVSRAITIGQYK